MTVSEMRTRSKLIYPALFLIITIIAILVRTIHLTSNPGWYSDEGTLVEVAKHLLDGKIQYFVFDKSTLLAARLPLFPAVLALVFSATGVKIAALRWLTAGLGSISVAMLMACIQSMKFEKAKILALTAGFCLAIYPKAILYSRLGFSYNLLVPLVVGMLWALYRYIDGGSGRMALLASLLVGIGMVSDLMMFTFIPVLILIVIFTNWKYLPFSILAFSMPFIVYALWMGFTQPAAFNFDFTYTFLRLGSIPIVAQYPYIVFNIAALGINDYWWVIGIAGFFLISDKRLKYLVLVMIIVPLFALGRTAALPGLGNYYLIPLFPLLALGAAALLVEGIPYAIEVLRDGAKTYLNRIADHAKWPCLKPAINFIVFLITVLLIFVLGLSPFVMTMALGFFQANTEIISNIDPVLVNVSDGQSAIDFVNSRVNRDDLVIASPALAWAIEANAADFQMSLAYLGQETMHFPTDIPRNRFLFDADYHSADFIIIDPIWTNWAALNMKGVEQMIREIEHWPEVFSSGEIKVYENPASQINTGSN